MMLLNVVQAPPFRRRRHRMRLERKCLRRQFVIPADQQRTLDRILESKHRMMDVRAQLMLHRRLKRWLVVHVATAAALLVLVVFHILTAMTLV